MTVYRARRDFQHKGRQYRIGDAVPVADGFAVYFGDAVEAAGPVTVPQVQHVADVAVQKPMAAPMNTAVTNSNKPGRRARKEK